MSAKRNNKNGKTTGDDSRASAAGVAAPDDARPHASEAVAASPGAQPVATHTATRHVVWGTLDVLVGLLMVLTIWVVLPARWMPVDVIGTIFAIASIAAGAGLVAGAPWARLAALALGGLTLVGGIALVTAVAFTASYLSGVYGPVGKGGAIILLFVALLMVPYFVLLPAAKIVALRQRDAGGVGPERAPAPAQPSGS